MGGQVWLSLKFGARTYSFHVGTFYTEVPSWGTADAEMKQAHLEGSNDWKASCCDYGRSGPKPPRFMLVLVGTICTEEPC